MFGVRVCFVFSSPLLLQLIIQHVEHKDEPAWRGYLYCAGLFLTNRFPSHALILLTSPVFSVAVVLDHNALQRVVVSAIQMRNAVVCAVYR